MLKIISFSHNYVFSNYYSVPAVYIVSMSRTKNATVLIAASTSVICYLDITCII